MKQTNHHFLSDFYVQHTIQNKCDLNRCMEIPEWTGTDRNIPEQTEMALGIDVNS